MENPAPTKQTKRKTKQGAGCPHCGGRSRTLPGGVTDNPLETVVYLQCQDVTCGATFRAVMMITTPDEPPKTQPHTAIEASDDLAEYCAEPAALKAG